MKGVRCHHLGHQSHLIRALRRHAFTGAEKRYAHDFSKRHLLQHVYGLEAGSHPKGDMRVEEGCILRGDDEFNFTEHVKSSSARDSVDRRDDRFPQIIGLWPDVVTGIIKMPWSLRSASDTGGAGPRHIVGTRPVTHGFLSID